VSKGFFSIGSDGNLEDVDETIVSSEADLQHLIATFPRLLSGDAESKPDVSGWLFITREMGIPSEEGQGSRWSVDHLFLDGEGIPTLVEVKRSSDSRIRREVVGQMLDYAAHASMYWPIDKIVSTFEDSCQERGQDPQEVLKEFLESEVEPEVFWDRVKTNLHAGKMRLIFLADQLPIELRTVIEYLNRQMDPTEVIGIEVKQYKANGFNALTSRVFGKTAEITQQRSAPGRPWDEEAFLTEIAQKGGSDDEELAKQLIAWSSQQNLSTEWGRGKLTGSFYPVVGVGGISTAIFAAWTDSQIELQFGSLKKRNSFESSEQRLELIRRFNEIPSVDIGLNRITGFPKFPFKAIQTNDDLKQFFSVVEWAISEIKRSS